jgi:hypothetical protein
MSRGNARKGDTPSAAPEAATAVASGHPHVMADKVWVVLARRAYDEPLRQVGTVEADDVDLARVYARSIYDEFVWIEMAVVPRDAVVTVIEA